MSNSDLDRRHPLFDAAVPVTVRASGSDPDVAPRALVVRVLTGTRMALGQREKLLHIEITDDSDLLFLYTHARSPTTRGSAASSSRTNEK